MAIETMFERLGRKIEIARRRRLSEKFLKPSSGLGLVHMTPQGWTYKPKFNPSTDAWDGVEAPQFYYDTLTGQELKDKWPWKLREGERVPPSAIDEGWIPWFGGECPLRGRTKLDVELRAGTRVHSLASYDFRWTHIGIGSDIVAIRPRGTWHSETPPELGDYFVRNTPSVGIDPSSNLYKLGWFLANWDGQTWSWDWYGPASGTPTNSRDNRRHSADPEYQWFG